MPPTDIEENEEELQDEQEEGSEAPAGGSKLVLWLVIAGLGVLFLPLYFISTTVKSTNEKLTAQLKDIQATLTAPVPVDPAKQTLSAEYIIAQNESSALASIKSTLMASHINWPTIMAAIGAYDTNQMTVSNVDQIENGIRISGRAKQEIIAMSYADMLRATGLFDVVAVESITLQSTIITVTPSNTNTPTPQLAEVTADPNQKPQPTATMTPLPTAELKVTDFIISVTIKKVDPTDGPST